MKGLREQLFGVLSIRAAVGAVDRKLPSSRRSGQHSFTTVLAIGPANSNERKKQADGLIFLYIQGGENDNSIPIPCGYTVDQFYEWVLSVRQGLDLTQAGKTTGLNPMEAAGGIEVWKSQGRGWLGGYDQSSKSSMLPENIAKQLANQLTANGSSIRYEHWYLQLR